IQILPATVRANAPVASNNTGFRVGGLRLGPGLEDRSFSTSAVVMSAGSPEPTLREAGSKPKLHASAQNESHILHYQSLTARYRWNLENGPRRARQKILFFPSPFHPSF